MGQVYLQHLPEGRLVRGEPPKQLLHLDTSHAPDKSHAKETQTRKPVTNPICSARPKPIATGGTAGWMAHELAELGLRRKLLVAKRFERDDRLIQRLHPLQQRSLRNLHLWPPHCSGHRSHTPAAPGGAGPWARARRAARLQTTCESFHRSSATDSLSSCCCTAASAAAAPSMPSAAARAESNARSSPLATGLARMSALSRRQRSVTSARRSAEQRSSSAASSAAALPASAYASVSCCSADAAWARSRAATCDGT
jgi:hypothetical protein